MRRRIGEGQRCGILFGPERNGLETEEVANADAAVMAPVNPNFASLNLAQAVLLVGYEWMKQANAGTLGRVTTYEEPLQPGLRTRGSPPATKEELIGFFEQLEGELDRQRLFTAPEKRPSVVQNMRSMFTRMGATEQEIRTLRGIVKALARRQAIRGENRHSYASFSIKRCAHAGQGGAANTNDTRTHCTGWAMKGLGNDGQRHEGGRGIGVGGGFALRERLRRRWPRPRSSATNRC